MVEVPKEEAEIAWRSIAEPDSEQMNISMDGAMVNVIDEGWKEVMTVTISAVEHEAEHKTGTERGALRTGLTHHSYRAGLWNAAEFSTHQWAEACGRGVERAPCLSSVNDGAAWIWNVTCMCCGNCVEILAW